MFITVIKGRWLNTQHITEVDEQGRDADGKRCTSIRMSNGDIVRVYPRTAEFEHFWMEWEKYLIRQEAAVEAGDREIERTKTRPNIDEAMMQIIAKMKHDAAASD